MSYTETPVAIAKKMRSLLDHNSIKTKNFYSNMSFSETQLSSSEIMGGKKSLHLIFLKKVLGDLVLSETSSVYSICVLVQVISMFSTFMSVKSYLTMVRYNIHRIPWD